MMLFDGLQDVQEPVVVDGTTRLGPELPPNSLTITGNLAVASSIFAIQASTLSSLLS